MKFVKKNILKTSRNGVVISSTSTSTIRGGGSSFSGNYLPATSNGDGTYTVNLNKVTFNGSINAAGEVSAYGKGDTGSLPSVNVVDNLTSSSTTDALSANLGRVLKSLIDAGGTGGGAVDLTNYYDKTDCNNKFLPKGNYLTTIPSEYITETELSRMNLASTGWVNTNYQPKGNYLTSIPKEYITEAEVNNELAKKSNIGHKHPKTDITDLNLAPYDNHIADKISHITQTERNKWNAKLDKSVWDKAFYFDGDNLKVHLNLIGDKEISAYGKGEISSGAMTIIDSLNSDATDAALSAKQGKVLKSMIENKEVNLDDYYDKTTSDDKYQPKGNYLTSQNLTGYAKETWVTSEIAKAATNGKVDLTGYAKTEDIPTLTSQLKNDSGFITDISGKVDKTTYTNDKKLLATKSDISDMETKTSAKATYQPIGNYLTSIPKEYITEQELSAMNLASTGWINQNFFTKTLINSLCWTKDNFTSVNVTNWNNTYSNFTKAFTIGADGIHCNLNFIGEKEVSAFGRGTSSGGGGNSSVLVVDNLESNSTEDALSANQGRILKTMIENKIVNLDNYYDKDTSDVRYQKKGNYLTSIPDEYITETELGKKGYITSYTNNYVSSITGSGNGTVTFNRNGLTSLTLNLNHTHSLYLTSSSLNGYAKTNLIPTKVSQLTNDKGYLISHQSLDDYYTKGEINTKFNNTVTLNTSQTISGTKTFTSALNVNNSIFCYDLSVGDGLILNGDAKAKIDADGYSLDLGTDGGITNGVNIGNEVTSVNINSQTNINGNTNIIGNLIVSGEITAYSSSGANVPFLYNDSDSNSTTQTVTAAALKKVNDDLQNQITDLTKRLDAMQKQINQLKK